MNRNLTNTQILALLTARGQNSFTDKHLATILGRPLVSYPAAAGRDSKKITHFYASSDDDRILDVAAQYGYRSIRRPAALSGPTSQHRDALIHSLGAVRRDGVAPDIVVVLLGNNAVVKASWIDDCIALLETDRSATSAVPVVRIMDHHPYRAKRLATDGTLVSFFDFDRMTISSNRQDLPPCYFLCHNFWVIRTENLLDADAGEPPWTFLGNKVLPYEVAFSQDVHCPDDLRPTEEWLKQEAPLEVLVDAR